MANTLHSLHVQVHVKPEAVEAFRVATLANAQASLKEAGVLRFDVYQDREDATRFVLVEVYRSREAHAAHRTTTHYLSWRDAVEALMAEPRVPRTFVNVFPSDDSW